MSHRCFLSCNEFKFGQGSHFESSKGELTQNAKNLLNTDVHAVDEFSHPFGLSIIIYLYPWKTRI